MNKTRTTLAHELLNFFKKLQINAYLNFIYHMKTVLVYSTFDPFSFPFVLGCVAYAQIVIQSYSLTEIHLLLCKVHAKIYIDSWRIKIQYFDLLFINSLLK